jgi:hypothetical protein
MMSSWLRWILRGGYTWTCPGTSIGKQEYEPRDFGWEAVPGSTFAEIRYRREFSPRKIEQLRYYNRPALFRENENCGAKSLFQLSRNTRITDCSPRRYRQSPGQYDPRAPGQLPVHAGRLWASRDGMLLSAWTAAELARDIRREDAGQHGSA